MLLHLSESTQMIFKRTRKTNDICERTMKNVVLCFPEIFSWKFSRRKTGFVSKKYFPTRKPTKTKWNESFFLMIVKQWKDVAHVRELTFLLTIRWVWREKESSSGTVKSLSNIFEYDVICFLLNDRCYLWTIENVSLVKNKFNSCFFSHPQLTVSNQLSMKHSVKMMFSVYFHGHPLVKSMRDSTCSVRIMMIISKINSQLVYHKLSILSTWHLSLSMDKCFFDEIDNIRSANKSKTVAPPHCPSENLQLIFSIMHSRTTEKHDKNKSKI